MRPFEQGMMSQSVVIAPPEGSGATSLLFKAHYQYGGHGNVTDTNASTHNYSKESFCDSVLTAIRQRSRLPSSNGSRDEWIGIPATRTSGGLVMHALNLSVWPAAIRERMRLLLCEQGGVPLEFPESQMTGRLSAKLLVPQATKLESISPALIVGPATADDDPPLNQT